MCTDRSKELMSFARLLGEGAGVYKRECVLRNDFVIEGISELEYKATCE